MHRTLLSILFVGTVLVSGCRVPVEMPTPAPGIEPIPATEPTPQPHGTLKVHYMDIDTADATLLQGPDFTILIDAGLPDRDEVVPYLKATGVESIDLLIGTHPHDDHIGQFPQVLHAFPVSEVWMSRGITAAQTVQRAIRTFPRVMETDWCVDTTRAFRQTIDAVAASGAAYNEPRAGEVYTLGSARIEVVHPERLTGNLNDDSLSVRITFGAVVFLFTGDAGIDAEHSMIARRHDLRAHILQLGHHGSRGASSQEFLEAVQPEVAIYSAGEVNWLTRFFREVFSSSKPHPEMLNRLAAMDISVYGTNVHGTIVVITDGVTYEVVSEHDTLPVTHDTVEHELESVVVGG